MFFSLPERKRDRAAILRILAVGPIGVLVIAFLTITGLIDAPTGFLTFQPMTPEAALGRWEIDIEHLLLVMPVGAVIVLFSRLVIGVDTFGIFTPMLLSLAFLQLGPLTGPLLIGGMVVLGMVVMPLLEKFDISRMGMMAVLIGMVSVLLYLAQKLIAGAVSLTAFPVVVTALVTERWWITHESHSPREAAWLAFATFLLATIIQFALVAPLLRGATTDWPLLVPAFAVLGAFVTARYRGLRITELFRFRPLLEENYVGSGN